MRERRRERPREGPVRTHRSMKNNRAHAREIGRNREEQGENKNTSPLTTFGCIFPSTSAGVESSPSPGGRDRRSSPNSAGHPPPHRRGKRGTRKGSSSSNRTDPPGRRRRRYTDRRSRSKGPCSTTVSRENRSGPCARSTPPAPDLRPQVQEKDEETLEM